MYFNFIDLTKLSRNYESQPLGLKEDIPLEDFKYLYIEENLTKKEVIQLCPTFFPFWVRFLAKIR